MSYDIARTELVWPGKYNDNGRPEEPQRVSLPFQVVERVGEGRATREKKKAKGLTLFDTYEADRGETFDDGWRNKLIWGDNELVMSSLMGQLAGKVDLIYIDPPFATGADFSVETLIGSEGESARKDQSLVEEKAYRDTWGAGKASWFQMMADRLYLMRELLSASGSIFVHLDWYVGHHCKVLLDEIFGEANSLGEIVWSYGSPSGGRVSGSKLVKAHDIIYGYAKEYGQHKYHVVYLPYSEKYVRDWFRHIDKDGRQFQKRQRIAKDTGERYWEKQYLDDSLGVPASTVWTDIQQVYADPRAYKLGTTSELTGYPTQKPTRLLGRLIEMASDEGDLIADFFCGSGTTAAAAEASGRRWLACDLGRYAIHTTRKRLLSTDSCRPFEILNLGHYERQLWHGAKFADIGSEDRGASLLQYIAFILRLYGASPLSESSALHGQRGKAFVHVGSVESPVTMEEVAGAVEECLAMKGSEVHVLGWEWEMGLNDTMTEQTRAKGVKLVLRQIPREVMEAQAASKGDIAFYELAYLEAEVKPVQGREFAVDLEDFLIPNPELIPDDVRRKIKTWSDFVDYWAVDWNFSEDTFMQGWVTYRTRKDRSLALHSDSHAYERPGEYSIMIKVIDIFGNDTSKIIKVKVK